MAICAHAWQQALCCAGPNEVQVAQFRARLSDPTALKTHISYHYSASLITDGLANGTDPVYVYTKPQCDSQPMTDTLLSLLHRRLYGMALVHDWCLQSALAPTSKAPR